MTPSSGMPKLLRLRRVGCPDPLPLGHRPSLLYRQWWFRRMMPTCIWWPSDVSPSPGVAQASTSTAQYARRHPALVKAASSGDTSTWFDLPRPDGHLTSFSPWRGGYRRGRCLHQPMAAQSAGPAWHRVRSRSLPQDRSLQVAKFEDQLPSPAPHALHEHRQ